MLRPILSGLAALALFAATADASNVGKRFPSEKFSFLDAATGYPITALTNNRDKNVRIYQTDPQWTHDGRHIIYRSDRGNPVSQIFAVNEGSGEIIQLTDDPTIIPGSVYVSRKTPRLFFVKRPASGAEIWELDLASLFADSAAGKSQDKPTGSYERRIGALPEGLGPAGGITVDADESVVYAGVDRLGVEATLRPPEGVTWRIPQIAGGIRAVDVKTGAWTTVVDTPFKIGHIQVNPWVPGEILYCHETGGDTIQRMWMVRRDGTGNRPLYVEGPDEWVTHEVVVGPDEVMFNLLGFQPKLATRPSGIAVLNLRNNRLSLLGQITEDVPLGFLGEGGTGGFWHCNGSPDGRWAAGDTFRGDLWLINRATGERTRLSVGHVMKPDHIHPFFSEDSSRILIQSGMLTDGANLNLMTIAVPQHLRDRR